MGLTNFPYGISSFGVPVFGGSIPAINGTYYHVCPYDGSDSHDGLTRETALATVTAAYNKCTTAVGDGIIVWSYNSGTTANTSTYLTAALTWSKNNITTVGICAPTMFAQRARIVSASTATTLTHVLDVTGDNNIFMNLHFGNYGSDATALGGVKVAGERNYFYNVSMLGAGNDTPAATATANSLALYGASENMFERCTIGSDTVNSVGTNQTYNLIFTSLCMRNIFKECLFSSKTTSGQAGHLAIAVRGAGDGISPNQYFWNCIFNNYNDGAVSAQTSLVGYPTAAPNNGQILLHDCAILGYADADSGSAAVTYSSRAAAGADGGVMAVC